MSVRKDVYSRSKELSNDCKGSSKQDVIIVLDAIRSGGSDNLGSLLVANAVLAYEREAVLAEKQAAWARQVSKWEIPLSAYAIPPFAILIAFIIVSIIVAAIASPYDAFDGRDIFIWLMLWLICLMVISPACIAVGILCSNLLRFFLRFFPRFFPRASTPNWNEKLFNGAFVLTTTVVTVAIISVLFLACSLIDSGFNSDVIAAAVGLLIAGLIILNIVLENI